MLRQLREELRDGERLPRKNDGGVDIAEWTEDKAPEMSPGMGKGESGRAQYKIAAVDEVDVAGALFAGNAAAAAPELGFDAKRVGEYLLRRHGSECLYTGIEKTRTARRTVHRLGFVHLR